MFAISAAVGRRVACAPTRMPATTASASTTSTGCSRTVATTSAAKSAAGPQMIRSRTKANWRAGFPPSMLLISAVCSSRVITCGAVRQAVNSQPAAPADASTVGSDRTRTECPRRTSLAARPRTGGIVPPPSMVASRNRPAPTGASLLPPDAPSNGAARPRELTTVTRVMTRTCVNEPRFRLLFQAWENASGAAGGSPLTAVVERSVVEPEELARGAAESVADGGERVEADRPGAAVLEDGQVDDGDSDAGGQFDQGHSLGLEKLVQVHRDPMLGGLGHQMTVSSSDRMATPRSRICPRAAKIKPTASHPSGD